MQPPPYKKLITKTQNNENLKLYCNLFKMKTIAQLLMLAIWKIFFKDLDGWENPNSK